MYIYIYIFALVFLNWFPLQPPSEPPSPGAESTPMGRGPGLPAIPNESRIDTKSKNYPET